MALIKLTRRAQAGLLGIIIVSVLLYFLGERIPRESIQSFLASFGPFAPVVFILVHQLSYIFAPISGIPFLIVGFYLFGLKTIIYLYFAGTLGSMINFAIAKKWGRPIVTKFAGRDALVKIDKLEKEYGLVALIALRVFLGGLGDFVSYAYGLTKMRFKTFIIVTVLAPIPSQVTWYFFASKTDTFEQFLLVSGLMFVVANILFFGGRYLAREIRSSRKLKP